MHNAENRVLESDSFSRKAADPAFLGGIAQWDVWTCDDAEYRHVYDQGVTLYVAEGAAVIEFSTGETVDLVAGDVLTIAQGAQAVWRISSPLKNSYQYH